MPWVPRKGEVVHLWMHHREWCIQNGVCTPEEADSLEVVRVKKKTAKNGEPAVWVGVRSTVSGNEFGPYLVEKLMPPQARAALGLGK